jgi:RNA polymerase sigma-70 factor (ECF subfamily)
MDSDLSLEGNSRLEESAYGTEGDIWKRAFQYAYSLVQNRADAEDLTQEAFVVLFREERAGRPVERVHAWMRTVTRHLAYRRYHKERPDLHLSFETMEDGESRVRYEPADPAPSPEKRAIDEGILHLSAQIMWEFSERDRECILMYFRGYDFLQIGSALGVSRWTARRTTLKALKEFQIRMNPSLK